MKDNWNRRLPCFDRKLKITGIVSWSPKLTCNMTMAPDLIILFIEFIFTNPTGICLGKFFLIFFCHNSVMLNSQDLIDFDQLLIDSSDKFLCSIFSSV